MCNNDIMIICAALLSDGKVFVGRSHSDAYESMAYNSHVAKGDVRDGFLNDKGAFLTRKEAAVEAIKCKQLTVKVAAGSDHSLNSYELQTATLNLTLARKFESEYNSGKRILSPAKKAKVLTDFQRMRMIVSGGIENNDLI